MRKEVKQICLLLLIAAMTFTFAGCGAKTVESGYTELKLDDYITVPDGYLGFEWEEPTVEITDEMVESQIKLTIESSTKDVENNEGKIKDGDKIKISYVALNEAGETIADNSNGYTVTMGKDYLTGEMEEAILGHAVGDTVEVKGKVADDFEYDESLQGANITYNITIVAKYDVEEATFDDEWVKANSTATTTDEYKELVKKDLYNTYYENAIDEIFTNKWSEIVEASEVLKDAPQELIDAEVDYFEGYVYYNGYQNMGLDIETLAQEYAVEAVKQKLVLYKICSDNDLIPTEEEFQEYCTQIITGQNYTEETFQDTFVYNSYDYGLKFGWLEEYLNVEAKKLILGL